MRKLVVLFVMTVASVVAVAGPVHAEPSASACRTITITVNGEVLVNDTGCNTVP